MSQRRPQWFVSFAQSMVGGFDRNAAPRWLMVPFGGDPVDVHLSDAGGMTVLSINPGVADIVESTSGSEDDREFTVTGNMPHVSTFIQVYRRFNILPSWADFRPVVRLEVNVKAPMPLKIALQHVTDDLFVPTERLKTATFAGGIDTELNGVYTPQTNINFTLTREVPVKVDTNLLAIRREQVDLENIRPTRAWLKLLEARDPAADINVFFMPWSGSKDKAPFRMFGVDGNCVCPDAIPAGTVRLAIAHMVGRLLGCSIIFDEGKKNHLMHWSAEKDDAVLGPDNKFISRDDANTMNGP